VQISITDSQRTVRISASKVKKTLKDALGYLINNVGGCRSLSLHNVEISVLFVNDKKMRELNLQYRGKDKTTDVLSFPQIERFKPFKQLKPLERLIPLGDIVISLPQAKRQSKEHGLTLYAEVSWLLIHGLLHLLGYDHETGAYRAGKMRKTEMELLAELNALSDKKILLSTNRNVRL
jgi:probable rRNA maturation factor